jgi:NAD(P)-dependent dehydrogenase (short-subunit alcohol dehydrogenase family)
MMHSLPDGYRALVLGASGAIGGALLAALQADARCSLALGWSRRGGLHADPRHATPAGLDLPRLDFGDEAALRVGTQALRVAAPWHLVLIATGVLHVDGTAPEKRLAELDPAVAARSFAVNTLGPAMAVKHLHELLPTRERGLLAVLSARVGSIADNRLGGWYSYRASKAALNMLLRTAAIEVARRRPLAVLAALHPGTVRSALSAPVIGREPDRDALAPEVSAARLLAVLDALPPEAPDGSRGHFMAWDGQPVPW